MFVLKFEKSTPTVKVFKKLLIRAPSEWAGSMMSFSLCFRGCHPLRVLSVVRTRPEARHARPDQYPLHTWDLTPGQLPTPAIKTPPILIIFLLFYRICFLSDRTLKIIYCGRKITSISHLGQ